MLADRSASSRKRARGEEAESTSPRDGEDTDKDETVSLRAGERVFTATRETWTLFPDSVVAMLVTLHSGSGEVSAFIDVDGDAFGRCVNYLRRRGARVVPPESDEALDAFAACADKLGLGRLTADLRLEERRRAWERELSCLDRDLVALRADARAARDANRYGASEKSEKTEPPKVMTRVVDIGREAKFAAKAAKPLHYGGHPSLGAAGAHEIDELSGELQELVDEGWRLKAITPLLSGPYDEGWGPNGNGERKGPTLTTLVLATLETPPETEPSPIRVLTSGVGCATGCVAYAVKMLARLYYRWLLQQLPQRFRARSAFVPTSETGDEEALDTTTVEMRYLALLLATEAATEAAGGDEDDLEEIRSASGINRRLILLDQIFTTPALLALGHAVKLVNDPDDRVYRDFVDVADDFEVEIPAHFESLVNQVEGLRVDFLEQHKALLALLKDAGV